MNILIYNSHNIINSQGLQKKQKKFENTMEGIFVQIASIFIVYFHVKIIVLRNIDTHMTSL